MIDSVDSIFNKKSTKTTSNNITLRKTYINPYGFDKIDMDKELIKVSFIEVTCQFNEWKIQVLSFIQNFWTKYILFYDENGRKCKILFDVNNKIIKELRWWKFKWKANKTKWILIALNAQSSQTTSLLKQDVK